MKNSVSKFYVSTERIGTFACKDTGKGSFNPFYRRLFIFSLILIVLLFTKSFAQKPSETLWFDKPASRWSEALPLGNSYMGAMVFADAALDRLQLNESTLYTGDPAGTYKSMDVRRSYKQAIALIKEKKYLEAEALLKKEWLGRNNQLYQPMSDLWLRFNHNNRPVENYKRSLDLTTATAKTEYKVGNTTYTRQYFMSYPDHVLVIKLTAQGGEKINASIRFSTPHKPTASYKAQTNRLTLKAKAPGFGLRRTLEHVESLGDQHKYPELYEMDGTRKPFAKQHLYDKEVNGWGMTFENQLKAINKDGSVKSEGDSLVISGASEVILVMSAATSFNGYNKSPVTEGLDPHKLTEGYLNAIDKKPFEVLYKTHLSDYQKLFGRVALQLAADTEQSKLTTDQRVDLFANGQDPNFSALYFNYGRYLMIAGSRKGGQPLNLQGIWNDQMIPPWNGTYTININLQMNYWPAEVANLSECLAPYYKAVNELAINGKETAMNTLGSEGWITHHNMDIWRHTESVDNCMCSFWPMGAGWLMSQFWESYLHNGDKAFLQKDIFPLLKGAVQFYRNWLVKNDQGYWVTPIGHSPENTFYYDGKKTASFDEGVTMDIAIVRESFDRYLEACRILNINDDFTKDIRQKMEKLLPYQIGKHGQLQEWANDFEEFEVQHRHFSHLYPIHPSNQITPQTTPELMAAVKRTMERRGDHASGWSMGWKTVVWARLQDGDHALNVMSNLFKLIAPHKKTSGGGTYPNLFCAHPPFQIDGNFGTTQGIAEMLIQSHAGDIHLLPALPKAWHTGHAKGLKTRGGFVVDMEWADGKITKATIRSTLGGNCRIRASKKMNVNAPSAAISGKNPNELFNFGDAGKAIIHDPSKVSPITLNQSFVIDFKTEKGRTYSLQ